MQKFFSKYQMNLTMGSKGKESTKVSIRNTKFLVSVGYVGIATLIKSIFNFTLAVRTIH